MWDDSGQLSQESVTEQVIEPELKFVVVFCKLLYSTGEFADNIVRRV